MRLEASPGDTAGFEACRWELAGTFHGSQSIRHWGKTRDSKSRNYPKRRYPFSKSQDTDWKGLTLSPEHHPSHLYKIWVHILKHNSITQIKWVGCKVINLSKTCTKDSRLVRTQQEKELYVHLDGTIVWDTIWTWINFLGKSNNKCQTRVPGFTSLSTAPGFHNEKKWNKLTININNLLSPSSVFLHINVWK